VPVATVAVGRAGARNAALLAAEIIALGDDALAGRLRAGRAPRLTRSPPPTASRRAAWRRRLNGAVAAAQPRRPVCCARRVQRRPAGPGVHAADGAEVRSGDWCVVATSTASGSAARTLCLARTAVMPRAGCRHRAAARHETEVRRAEELTRVERTR
jgi:hypothetical protein